jgi:glycosyltransferase involved in cell wall biosynthesis
VIVPCYNYAHYLAACVESVLSQAGTDVELLIIDDCSTDESARVGTELARDPRVTFRQHVRNRGHIETYNEGLDWAQGDYTVLLSADDLLTPGALARAASVLDADPRIGMVYGGVLRFESHADLPTPRVGAATSRVWSGAEWIARRCRSGRSSVSSPEVVVRTSLYKQLGGYRPELPHSGDQEMWLRIAAHADVAFLRGVDQAFYRVHAASMSQTTYSTVIIDLYQRRAAFDALFEHHGSYLPDASLLRRDANRALAREALWRACRAFDRRRLGSESVEELEAFARDTYPRAENLREYWGLRLRRRLGPAWSPRVQFALPSVYAHWLARKLWLQRVELFGN